VAGRSDAKIMFELCSDTESAKTIKALREVVDSLYAQAASVDMFTDTFLPIADIPVDSWRRNRKGRVRGERAGVAPNQ